MKRYFFHLLVAASALSLAETSLAQPDVVQATKDAVKGFQPIAAQDVAAAKAEVQAAVADLDALLKRSPSQYDAGWRKFLRWEDLQSQLRAEGPDTKTA